jgi:acetoin utilization deacetylase AcuC-like enzyme
MRHLYYTDHLTIDLPPGHKFPMAKYRLVREMLTADGLFAFEPAPFAEASLIELAHEPEYVQAFLGGGLDASAIRKIGFPWSEGLVKRTLASVGGTLTAARDALADSWGGTLAGGTHHAFAAEGSGFCVFNDIAIAIRALRAEGPVRKAAVVDLDVHQGDGTAHIFREDEDVLTLSIHCKANFPLRKQQSNIDVALDAGVGDNEYLERLSNVLPRVLEFEPEIVFYQSGVDGLECDALGHLALTHDGLIERDRMVLAMARAARIPLVITLGGGYSNPIEATAEAHANTYRVAAEIFGLETNRS